MLNILRVCDERASQELDNAGGLNEIPAGFDTARRSLPHFAAGATMLRSKTRRRALFGEKFLDLANYAAAALVFSQFVGQQPASWKVAIAGVVAWLVFAAMSYWLAGER